MSDRQVEREQIQRAINATVVPYAIDREPLLVVYRPRHSADRDYVYRGRHRA